jgi:hypothetical protein
MRLMRFKTTMNLPMAQSLAQSQADCLKINFKANPSAIKTLEQCSKAYLQQAKT